MNPEEVNALVDDIAVQMNFSFKLTNCTIHSNHRTLLNAIENTKSRGVHPSSLRLTI